MEVLPDPEGDRNPVVPAPPNQPLASSSLWPDGESGAPDWMLLKDFLSKEGKLAKEDVVSLIETATAIMKREPNLVPVPEPIVIVGDIHGQYYDLCHLLGKAGDPSKINFLFLGDYVDRGIFGVECVLLLFAMKITYKESFVMLRGNHETKNMTQHFTFREETLEKYDEEVYELFIESFNSMPIAAVADDKYICMHGGISPELKKINEINDVNRFIEPPLKGLICDLLWSDPAEDKRASKVEWKDNEERECSYYFGKKPTQKLLDRNNLISVIRAHQVKIEGYMMHRWDGENSFPHVITIFSAPNYCDYYSNKASVLLLTDGNVSIKQFDQSDHPYHLPERIDLFSWSVPFMVDKVMTIFKYIVEKYATEDANVELPKEEGSRSEIMRKKVKAIARVQKMYNTLVTEQELILKLKGMVPDGKIPRGVLLEGRPAIKDALREFEMAMKLDSPNEKRPPE